MDRADPLGKIPPQHLEAEEFVLGAILIDNQALNKALEVLSPSAWYREAHRKIFQAMIELSEVNEAIDQVTVSEYLRRRNELEQIGGAAPPPQPGAQGPPPAHPPPHTTNL